MQRHLLGPDPLVEPRTYRITADDGDHLHVGHVNSLPSTVGGGGFHADAKMPRLREDDFRVLVDVRTSGGRVGRRLAVLATPTSSRTTPRRSASWAWPARRRTRSPRGGRRPYRDAAGPGHVRRGALDGRGRAGRAAPVPGADRHQLAALRRPAGLQQLRVLRMVRLPDRRQGRPGRAAAASLEDRPMRDPPAGPGHRGRARCVRSEGDGHPLPRRASVRCRRCAPTTSCWPAARSRRRG